MPHETYTARVRKTRNSVKIPQEIRDILELKANQLVKVTIETLE
jgi:hypothetical protein